MGKKRREESLILHEFMLKAQRQEHTLQLSVFLILLILLLLKAISLAMGWLILSLYDKWDSVRIIANASKEYVIRKRIDVRNVLLMRNAVELRRFVIPKLTCVKLVRLLVAISTLKKHH